MEVSKLPVKVFKVILINMLTEFRRDMDEHSENVKKCRIYKQQIEVTELKNMLTELENILEDFSSKQDEAEEWISELEDKAMKFIQTAAKKNFKK